VQFPYFPGAIYPSELVFFLSLCIQAKVGCIIESGRGEGYSTAVIAAFGEAKNIRIVSIDTEDIPERARECRRRLAQFKRLEVLAGNAFDEIPRLLRGESRPVALLIDGPKYDESIYLSAASVAFGSVSVVAHHNIQPEIAYWYSHFVERFPRSGRLEDSGIKDHPAFKEFREWEQRETSRYEDLGRSLESTSLLASLLPEPGPSTRYLKGPSLKHTAYATILYWWWKLGTPAKGGIYFLIKLKNKIKGRLGI
jgi:predicted O-methyltransferase YrrM